MKKLTLLISVILSMSGCGKAVTVVLVNHSSSHIIITEEKRSLSCPPGEAVVFIPQQHDLVIMAGEAALSYEYKPFPQHFLERKPKKRFFLAFKDDDKLYLLEPAAGPFTGDVGPQPVGYPLSPSASAAGVRPGHQSGTRCL